MKIRNSRLGIWATAGVLTAAFLFHPFRVIAQSVTLISLAASEVAYSDATKLVYASTTNTGTLTPVNPVDGTLGTPISVPNIGGQLCASDGGQYIFAALNDPTNHICQVDVNAQAVVTNWTLGGNYVDDMAAVPGSPAAVAVSRKVLGRSPRFAGVAIYDNGVARSVTYSPFLGPTRIECSRATNRLYGYNNETSPASTSIMKVDNSGVTQIGGWSALQGFGVDIFWRAGWLFATNGQIFEPDRGIQVSSFVNTPVSDDAASGRYYLVSSGAIVGYDQNTLLPVGATALPGVTVFSARSLVRCGTNGFAMRMNSSQIALMRTPLLSSGSPADLVLSVAAPSQPVPMNGQLTYTLTISNQGPNTAQNVVLTQTLPGNSSFVSTTSSSGTNLPTSGGLVSSPLIIPANGTVVVTVNLHTLKAGLLASIASLTSDSLDPNLSNNVLRLEYSVGAAPATNSVTEVSLQTTDIVWDKISGRIFASIPNANWLLGNSIAALDPATGIFEARIPTTIEPGKLAVADNGQYLYTSISSDTSIQRINIPSRTLDIKFSTGFNGVNDMAVMPAFPQTIIATVYNTFAVYDDGVRRPNTVGPNPYNYGSYLTLSDDNAIVYEGLPNEFRRIAINSAGASLSYSTGLINSFDDQIKFGGGRVYTSGGRVIDSVAQVVVTNLPYNGLVCPDPRAGKIFYLTVSGSTGTLHVVAMTNLSEIGNVTVTNISGSATSLIRWGQDGLVFRTTGSQLFLIRTSLADDDINHDGISDYWEMANFGTLNINPNDDPDQDGMSNLAEFLAGTNPNDSNSMVRIIQISPQDGNFLLNWQAGINAAYYLQRSQSLGNPAAWQTILTNPPSPSSLGTFTDFNAPNTANFYRISVGSP